MTRRRWLDGLILILSLHASAGVCADADVERVYTDNRESSTQAQLLAVDERLDRAVFENDVQTLQSLYSDDFRYYHAGAAAIDSTKQAAIEHGAPDGLYLSRQRSALEFRIFGDTALISYFVTLQHDIKKFPMVPPKTRYHQQRVYAREHDEWRLVSQHSTWAVDTVEQSTEAMRYFYKQGYMNRE